MFFLRFGPLPLRNLTSALDFIVLPYVITTEVRLANVFLKGFANQSLWRKALWGRGVHLLVPKGIHFSDHFNYIEMYLVLIKYFSLGKWKLASRAATVTMVGAMGGGAFAMFYCYAIRRKKYKGVLDIPLLSVGILGGLVGITAICAVTRPWEGFIIGILGGAAGIGG